MNWDRCHSLVTSCLFNNTNIWLHFVLDMRLKFLTLLMLVVLSISLAITILRFGVGVLEDNFVAQLSTHYNSSAQFMSFYGLLNFYLFSMAYVYSPGTPSIHGKLICFHLYYFLIQSSGSNRKKKSWSTGCLCDKNYIRTRIFHFFIIFLLLSFFNNCLDIEKISFGSLVFGFFEHSWYDVKVEVWKHAAVHQRLQ